MNKNNDKQREMLITKDSLRPPNTRSKTPCIIPSAKESIEQQELPDIAEPMQDDQIIKKPRCRRQWIEWSGEEKRSFYDGLAEFGKDYGKIQSFMNKKLKLKNNADGKTKEQIRFFYHRTWSKISKSLNIQHEDDNKKANRREIHYLLCLGELRKKKSIGFGAKVMKQLDELVRKGFTYVRLNGRNIRVRPPNRYLKRLYRDVSDLPDIILPKSVTVEFLPNSNVSFNFVQQHAFNPRLRFTGVNINAKFSEVFDMVNKRFTDLYSNGNKNLYIYPLQSDLDCSKFAEVLSNAVDALDNFEKIQGEDIVLEKSKNKKDSTLVEEDKDIQMDEDESEIENVFPKIFGKQSESKITESDSKVPINSFPGYWTYGTAEHIFMRTLFVAFDQKQVLKFKYEWKLMLEEAPSTFATDSMRYLVNLCESSKREIMKKENELKKPLILPTKVIYEQKPVVPGIIPTNQNGLVTANNFSLPLRPRPGRKRSQCNRPLHGPKSPIVPCVKATNKLLKNAVAVNLIPQPPQLVQFAHLPPDSMKLVNSRSNAHLTKQSKIGVSSVQEEVMEEGFQEHFQSLKNMIASSNLNSGDNKNRITIQTTPKKNQILKLVPASPNLEWLNDSMDISLTGFLNVSDLQAIQQQQKDNLPRHIFVKDGSRSVNVLKTYDERVKCNNNLKSNGTVDPVLPSFDSGDTSSQGAMYGLSFELSNPAAQTKSKDHYSLT